MALEEQAINPTPIETEDSADFDPMDMLSRVDQAHNEELQKSAQPGTEETPPADEATPPAGTEETPPADQPEAGKGEQPNPDGTAPQGEEQPKVTPEYLKQLQAAAKEAIRYRNFFNSEKGQKLLDAMQKEEEAANAAAAGTQGDEDPEASAEDRFKTVFAELLGIDKDHELFDILAKKFKSEVDRAVAPMRQQYESAQLAQEANAGNEMAADFVEHLIEDFEMPEKTAKLAALRALHDIREKHPRFDQQTYYNEFLRFEKIHLTPVRDRMVRERIKTLEDELEAYKSGKFPAAKQPEATPPNTSTKEAAARIISEQDAGFKANGGIPGGSQIPAGTPDAGTQIADMIASLTSD